MPEYSFARLVSFALVFAAVFLGAWVWLQNWAHLRLLVWLLLASIVIGALLSGWYVLESTSLIPDSRFTGAFGKATGTGSFAAAALPLALWKLRYSRGKTKLLFSLVAGMLFYLLVFSGARAALVGGTAAAIVWFWKHRPSFRPALAAAAFLTAFLVVAGIIGLDMLPQYIVRPESLPTFTGRIPRWKAGLALFAESPVIGHGYGMTRYIRLYEENESLSGRLVPGRASLLDVIPGFGSVSLGRMTLHSDHVERLVEMGVMGYVPFALFWAFVLRRLVRVFWLRPGLETSLAMALGLNVSYVFLDSFMHGALFAINSGGVIFSWLTIVAFMRASDYVVSAGRPV